MAALDPIAEAATAGRGTYKANCSSATAAVCLAGQMRSFEQASFSLAAFAEAHPRCYALTETRSGGVSKRYIYISPAAGPTADSAAASVAASSGRCPAAGDL